MQPIPETLPEPNVREKKPFDFKSLFYILISAILGFAFGFILEKCKVYEPIYIRQQMIFQKFIMMKMFFTALATSTLAIFLMNLFLKERYSIVFESYRDMLKSKSFLVLISGGLILGLGMQIAGTCPGMIFVQLGAGVGYSYVALIGGLLGGLVHGVLSSYMSRSSQSDQNASKTLFELFKIDANLTRIIFISLLYSAVILMEIFLPWQNDYNFRNKETEFFSFSSEVWPPYLAGLLLGSLQFFSIALASKSLGASSCFSSFASFMFVGPALEKFPYLKKFRSGRVNFGTIVFVVCVVLGSAVSSYLGGVYGLAKAVNPFNAFLGGFLLVFGARLAGGCNTGHGISGTSHLFLGSFSAMMSMFAGGILLGLYAYTNDFFF